MREAIRAPNFSYDPEVDALYITIKDTRIDRTKQLASNIIVDYDGDGEIVGIEILEITQRLTR